MSERIDDFFGGRLRRHDLSDRERAEVEALERTAEQARAFLASRPAPDVTAAVLARIGDQAASPVSVSPAVQTRPGLVQRLWTPVQLQVRPAYVLLTAAALILLALWPFIRGTAPLSPAAAVEPAPVFVQFRLEADAARVQLAGSFTSWEGRYELRQSQPGVWTLTVPLTEGVHDYAFLIDGERWVADPYAARVSDGFGGANSRLTLLLPNRPAQS
jgi:hypothetical protein